MTVPIVVAVARSHMWKYSRTGVPFAVEPHPVSSAIRFIVLKRLLLVRLS